MKKILLYMKSKEEYFYIFSLIIIIVTIKLFYGKTISGPFIFGDESTYFQLARNLANSGGFSTHSQYGPLYPFLISILFNIFNDIDVYNAAKLFNLIIFYSGIIPIYLLIKEHTNSSILSLGVSLITVLMPYGSFSYLIWAEPVYFTILAWIVFSYYKYSSSLSPIYAGVSGVFIGLAFLLKPAVILLTISALIIELFKYYLYRKNLYYKNYKSTSILIVAMFSISSLWMMRNLIFTEGGLLGYPLAQQEMNNRIIEIGILRFSYETLISILYQISYIILGSFGTIIPTTIFLITKWSKIKPALRWSILYVLIVLSGLVVMSALHMTSYKVLGYHVPNGRYYCGYFPFLFIFLLLIIYDTKELSRHELKNIFIFSLLGFLVVFFASPLLMVTPYSLANNPELAVFFVLLDGGHIVWRGLYEPTILERALVSIFVCTMIFISILAMSKYLLRLPVLCLMSCLILYGGLQSHRLVVKLGTSQSPMNEAVKFSLSRTNIDKIYFDSDLKGGNVEFIMETWSGFQTANFIKHPNIISKYKPVILGNLIYFITPKELNLYKVKKFEWLNVYIANDD